MGLVHRLGHFGGCGVRRLGFFFFFGGGGVRCLVVWIWVVVVLGCTVWVQGSGLGSAGSGSKIARTDQGRNQAWILFRAGP